VDEALPVGVVDGGGHRLHGLHLLPQGQLGGSHIQGLALDVLHCDVGLTLPVPHLVDPADVGVLKASLELSLQDEPRHQLWLEPSKKLEGDHPTQGAVEALVDATHAPFADEPQVAVVAPLRDGQGREDSGHPLA